ncbi:TatD family hydrolase [Psychrobium sp. 1_MG-2023]|uniref:TatD family hydrolase n=1 Tax=Psychrobium sp. 1_MG-2023 TaxID=3062624 RepID=UPI000C32170A|nr:TatD family hydrolase [Psychrobium sp. 1_MG-2023]MDP2561993.1 TatD family hydrolase [Psychrobium sp. 1_MG-2023]PKF58625.1 hydrolase TatD [Alteromonadales bacterium alter-6D02]
MPESYIDIAVNISNGPLETRVEQIIEEAKAVNVNHLIALGCNIVNTEKAILLSKRFPGSIYATAGIHPHDAKTFDQHSIAQLSAFAQEPTVVALGECGLDFNRDFSPRPKQEYAFEAQLELAATLNMPIIMHQRDAHDRFITIFERYKSDISKGVVHCFTGEESELNDLLSLDLHIGITGWICDERRGLHLLESVHLIPDNRLMLETDSPYLIPRDLKPKPKSRNNVPANLPHIAARVAQARGQSLEQLSKNCYKTTKQFFDIK